MADTHPRQKWTVKKSLLAAAPIALAMAGTQAGLILALRALRPLGVRWPATLMAVLSAALLAAGVLRHYWDIYTHRTVRGVSFLFVGIDAAGDVFSLASVFFQGPPPVDVLGVVIYATELVLWMGVLGAGGWYNLRPWVRRKGWLKGGRDGREGVSAEEEEEEGERVDGGVTTRRRGEAEGGGIALHDLPSSTSVFRTASAEADVRQRHAASS